MPRYLINRAIGLLVVLLLVVTIVFVIVRVMPGDPAIIMLGPDAQEKDIAAMRERLGLNRILPVQYAGFLADILRGDLGESIFLRQPVLSVMIERAEPTLLLALMSILLSTIIALPIGILSALWRGSAFDQIALGGAVLVASIPSFWLSLLLIQFLAVYLGWVPVAGYGPPGASFLERVHHLLLPALTIGIVNSSLIARFTRASVLEVLNEDYVRTARAKGLAERTVILKHVLRNALVQIITVIGLTTALLISGAVVIETVFGVPGIGNLVVTAVQRRDYPVIQGVLLASAAAYVIVNTLIDLCYAVIDPRVRY